ncbi:MAG: ATP-binding protein [Deltaproteobacteria bacterium]|nr:ATP-binding protein [Deltaproteobacteria bacterium]MBI3294945.1 ATP-binding protein [Deltaproteobacteria bacterium]
MPHLRRRHLQEPFDKLIRQARIVGILGHRQVGKTTFLERVADEFVTLDDEDSFRSAQLSPKAFVASLKARRSGIDECQLVPGLFPALKVRVGTSSIPGRFILSGSVRFTSRKAIRESLTGRISNLEMYPFVLTELTGEPNSSFLFKAIGASTIESLVVIADGQVSAMKQRTKTINSFLQNGGLPALFHIRNRNSQAALLRDILETILDRDLRLVYRTSLPYQRIHEYCSALASSPLQIVRPGTLRKNVRIAETAQHHLLHALESVFLVRRIPVEGDYQGDLFWFEDQIERSHFTSTMNVDDADWITLIYRNARAQFGYRLGEHADYFHFRTRGGSQIPLGIRTRQGILGIVSIESRRDINLSLKRSADSFLKTYNHSKVLFLTRAGTTCEALSDRVGVLPVQTALF